MDKQPKKKPMFVMKETLVHLTPDHMGQVQGARGGILAKPTDTEPTEPGCQRYTCVYTKY